MQQDLNRVIEQVSKEKGIDKSILIGALENAMISAAKKTYGHDRKIEAQFNAEIGEVELFEIKKIVELITDPESEITLQEARDTLDPEAELGDELLTKLDSSSFGRIAAQAAKQNIVQKVRDAEREIIYNEFKQREGELIHGTVQRFEKRSLIVNLGRTNAILPEKEQVPRERYRQNDRIRAYIVSVEMTSRGPQIVLSRTHPNMLIKLFLQEVPEIYEGIVEVKGVAREPGGRAKIAVVSRDSDVDPVGACVGMRGTRVQSVVQELRGEKIDIVHWTEDQAEYVCRALAPAKMTKIIISEDEHTMEVICPDDQLSLAIGRKGQNVRLASRLTGWKIDVRGEVEVEEENRRARISLAAVPGISDVLAELLYQAGFKSAEELAETELESIQEVEGLTAEKAEALYHSSRAHVEEKKKLEEQRKAEESRIAAEEECRQSCISLATVPGVSEEIAKLLYQAGVKSAEELAETELESIQGIDGLMAEKAEALYHSSRAHVEEKKKLEEQRKAEESSAAEGVLDERNKAEVAASNKVEEGDSDGRTPSEGSEGEGPIKE